MADAAHKATDREIRRIEKELEAVYSRANKELSEKAANYFARFAEQDKQKKALVDAGKMSKGEYREWREAQIMRGKHWTSLKEQTAQEMLKANRTAMEYVNGRLPQVYAINYNYAAKDIQMQCQNAVSFELINTDAVLDLVEAGDKSLLPRKVLDPAKDIPWNMKMVNAEVAQGIIQGESIPDIAKRLQNVGVKNADSAMRTARTIVNGTQNKARHDAAERAAKKGVIMGKCWIGTNDKRIRDWHAEAWADYGDKEDAVELDEPFIVMGEEMMYPGDRSASPANVYNCRCTHKNVVQGFSSILPPEKRGKVRVVFDE